MAELTIDGLPAGTGAPPAFNDLFARRDVSELTVEQYTKRDTIAQTLAMGRVQTLADLKSITVSQIEDRQQIEVLGYYAVGDLGGGLFYYDLASAASANNGTVVAPTSGSGRWKRVYSGPLSVAWFGAKGDGSTDDTSAISATVAAAGTGGTVWFEAGKTYKTTSQIAVGSDRVSLLGNGAIITSALAAQHSKFRWYARSGGVVSGLRFECLSLSGSAGTGTIDIDASSDITVEDCFFKQTPLGIRVIGDCKRVNIRGNRFYQNFCGISFDDASDVLPTACVIANNHISAGVSTSSYSGGIKMSGGAHLTATVCGNVVSGNTVVDAGEMGIEVQAENDVTVSGNTVSGCTFGISAADAERVSITGNSVQNCSFIGIEVASTSAGCSVIGNVVDLSDINGEVSAVSINSASVRTTVSGNTFLGPTAAPNRTVYTQSSYCNISNNSIRGGVYLHNASHVLLSGNDIDCNGGTQAFWFDSSDAAVEDIAISGNSVRAAAEVNCAFLLYSPNSRRIGDVLVSGNHFNLQGTAGFVNQTFDTSTADAYVQGIRFIGNSYVGPAGNGCYRAELPAYPVSTAETTFSGFWGYYYMDGGGIAYNASGGAGALRLPNAVYLDGYTVTITKVDSSGNAVTISTYNSQTINGAATVSLASQWKRVTVRSDGANWIIVQSN